MRLLLFTLFFIYHSNAIAQWEQGTITNKDVVISYKVFGKEGKPLLLINGGPGFSSNYLTNVATLLSEKYKVITYDQRGTGQSTVPAMTKSYVNIPNNIEDIHRLQDSLGLEKVNVIGHAYGGALAMMYASSYPDRVDKLILSSSVGLNLDYVKPMIANLRVRLGETEINELAAVDKALQSDMKGNKILMRKRFDLVADALVYYQENIEAAKKMHQEEKDFVFEVNQIIWDEMNKSELDLTKKMMKYKGKVLILHGQQDVIGESVPLLTHMRIPNSTLIFINQAGRFLWLDQPDDYFTHLQEFLD